MNNMLWKRQIPILIVAVIGSITLFGWFINEPNVKEFVEDDATQWYNILASFAAILGALNLIKILTAENQTNKKKTYGYSLRELSSSLQIRPLPSTLPQLTVE